MPRRPGRSRLAQEAVGFLLASYVRFVQRTNHFTTDLSTSTRRSRARRR